MMKIFIRRMQIDLFINKLDNRIGVEKNRLWRYCNISKISLAGYKPFEDSSSLKLKLRGLLGCVTKEIIDNAGKEEKDTILLLAELSIKHKFNLLGSGWVLINPIDWHIDIKSGNRWGKKFYRDIRKQESGDIKMPWELSRCQHLLWLGEVYLLTGNGRYAQEVIDEINWWIDDNPLMYSVNWTCAMDVAFRAVNWMYSLNMIAKYEGFDSAFSKKVSISLWQHGFFIRNNLERTIPDSNNHYTSDLVGLLYLGALFNNTRRGRRWLKFAKKELVSEIRNQVLSSGVHYERSVSYHRMMTEMLSYPVYMLQRIGEKLPDDVMGRIKAMYAYTANYTKPNGQSPLIADNDDGRFLPFVRRDFRFHNYLNNPDSIENRQVSVGLKPMFCTEAKETKLYDDAGVAVIHRGEDYMFVNNGGYSKRPTANQITIGSHTHNDLLSFELVMNGKDVIVDAGTYLYTSSDTERNAFRSTAKHNTIMVDDEEQNGFAAPFALKRNVHIGKLVRIDDGTFEGDYITINGNMHHRRVFSFRDGVYVINDRIKKEGANHVAYLYYHFAKEIEPTIQGDSIIVDDIASISFLVKPNNMEIVDDTLSPSFGVLVQSKTAKLTYKFNDEIQITTEISHIYG